MKDVNQESISSRIDKMNVSTIEPKKKSGDAYNNQKSAMALNYIDFIRLRLLTMDKEKIIDRCQNLIVANKDIKNYKDYSTQLEIGINKSNVNLIFNTPTFSSNNGINKFNSFTFKRSYN